MADTKISALTDGAPAEGTDQLPAVRDPSGTPSNVRLDVDDVLAYVEANATAFESITVDQGATDPAAALIPGGTGVQVSSDTQWPQSVVILASDTAGHAPTRSFVRARGTPGTPTATQDGDTLAFPASAWGFDGTARVAYGQVVVKRDGTSSSWEIQNGNGSGSQTTRFKIAGGGDVSLGPFVFNGSQTVGAGQDNFVLTYDHATGKIALKAAAAGSSITTGSGAPGSAPASAGLFYLDTTAFTLYYSIGTADADDWTALLGEGAGDTLSDFGAVALSDLALVADPGTGAFGTRTNNNWTADLMASVALPDGTTITPDFAAGRNFHVTLGGDRTLANPTNQAAGQAGRILVKQDGTGTQTLAYGTDWNFPGGAPTLTTTANAVDMIVYDVQASGEIYATLIKDFS